MEDIDATRCRPEFEAAIHEDLAWLGMRGNSRCGGSPSISTIPRGARKAQAMRLTFPSFESRAEIAHMVGDRDVRERWPRDPDGVPLYPGAARQMKEQDRQARIAAAILTPSASTWRRRWNGPGRCAGAKPARARR